MCAFPFNKTINVLVFILANVIIDIEPLLVMSFNLAYPLHGYAHTFLGAIIIGGLFGYLSFKSKKILNIIMKLLKLPFEFSMKQYICSGVFGAVLHLLFDAPLYTDIKPFYPLLNNPLYGLVFSSFMYGICLLLFILAIILYVYVIIKNKNSDSSLKIR
ncbi:MAG: hydrolase [bacterium]|nr:hydrolase [bacterium]